MSRKVQRYTFKNRWFGSVFKILLLHLCLCTCELTQGSLELRAFRKWSMQPFCRTVTPTSSLLADSRKSVIAVSILTSSMSGLDSSKKKHTQTCFWLTVMLCFFFCRLARQGKFLLHRKTKSQSLIMNACGWAHLAANTQVQMPGCSSQGWSTASARSPSGLLGRWRWS